MHPSRLRLRSHLPHRRTLSEPQYEAHQVPGQVDAGSPSGLPHSRSSSGHHSPGRWGGARGPPPFSHPLDCFETGRILVVSPDRCCMKTRTQPAKKKTCSTDAVSSSSPTEAVRHSFVFNTHRRAVAPPPAMPLAPISRPQPFSSVVSPAACLKIGTRTRARTHTAFQRRPALRARPEDGGRAEETGSRGCAAREGRDPGRLLRCRPRPRVGQSHGRPAGRDRQRQRYGRRRKREG